MKYTRYDIKSKKKKNDDWKTTLLMIVVVLILAVLIGSFLFFKVFPPNMKSKGEKPEQTQGENNGGDNGGDAVVPPVAEEKEEAGKEKEKEQEPAKEQAKEEVPATNAPIEYTMVQCGYFSTKEGADSVKNTIGPNAKVLTEDGKFRVVSYLGTEEEAGKVSQELTTKEIENTKTRFKLEDESTTDKAIKEIIKGALDISQKLTSGEVASVKTEEFKNWANNLKEDEADDKHANFKVLKDNINSLPAEVKSADSEKIYQMVYDILRTYK